MIARLLELGQTLPQLLVLEILFVAVNTFFRAGGDVGARGGNCTRGNSFLDPGKMSR